LPPLHELAAWIVYGGERKAGSLGPNPKCSRRFGSRQSFKVSDCRQRVPSFLPAAGNSGWYLLELDQPFDYQIKVGEPYQFRGTTITHFLIRSRWLGHALGGPEPVSVFVLLVEDGSVPAQGPIDVKHYFHAAWGMCRVPPDGA